MDSSLSLLAMTLAGARIPPEPRAGLMLTDPTETGDFHHPHEEGFTQAWDTVGAGALPTHVRESSPERSVRLQL